MGMIIKYGPPHFSFRRHGGALAAMLAMTLAGCAATESGKADIRVLANPRVGIQKLPGDKSGAVLVKEEWEFVLCQKCNAKSPSGKLVWLIVSTDKKWEPVEDEGEEVTAESAGAMGKAVKHFAFDSSKVSGDVSEMEAILKTLNASPAARIQITGFTDSAGDSKYNLKLSKRRAKAVADWFVKHGVSRERMVVEGRGEQSPVSDNGTLQGRADNRRSETVVSVEVL